VRESAPFGLPVVPRRVDQQQRVVVRDLRSRPARRAVRAASSGSKSRPVARGERCVLVLDEEHDGSASSSWKRSSGAASRQFSGSRMKPAFAQAKKTITCSGELPVSVATRHRAQPAREQLAASASERASSSRT
jgi:hypothetical protein